MEKYKYTGPTMLLGVYDNVELRNGDEVSAEVNINIATIYEIYGKHGTYVLNDSKVDVAAKYMEPVKPDTIRFDSDEDVQPDNFFDKLFEQIGKINAEHEIPFAYIRRGKPWSITEENIRNYEKEASDILNKKLSDSDDHHEVGGDHYKMAIEPWDYIHANGLGFDEGNIVKYASRHKQKNGAEDIKKIISYANHILKTQYNEGNK